MIQFYVRQAWVHEQDRHWQKYWPFRVHIPILAIHYNRPNYRYKPQSQELQRYEQMELSSRQRHRTRVSFGLFRILSVHGFRVQSQRLLFLRHGPVSHRTAFPQWEFHQLQYCHWGDPALALSWPGASYGANSKRFGNYQGQAHALTPMRFPQISGLLCTTSLGTTIWEVFVFLGR